MALFQRAVGGSIPPSRTLVELWAKKLERVDSRTIFGGYNIEDLDVKILNGGYPVNFDRIKDSTPDEDIVLTRCLLYIGAMQATYLLSGTEENSGVYDLDTISQERLLERWIETKRELAQIHHVKEEDRASIVAYSSIKNAEKTPSVWED